MAASTSPSGNVLLARTLYQDYLDNSPRGNYAAAPFALESLLTLVRCGTKNESAYDIKSALRLPDSPKETVNNITSIDTTLRKGKNFRSLVANRIYLDQSFPIKTGFKKFVDQYRIAEVENIDFTDAKDRINSWVKAATQDKIPEVIETSYKMDDSFKILLVSAVYFKGHWLKQFQRDSVQMKNFFVSNNNAVQAEMMEKTGQYRYTEDKKLKAQIVEVPFDGKEVSMVIILPDDKNGLSDVENQINDIFNLSSQLKEERVTILIPKFKFVNKVDNLKRSFQHLGMKQVFTDEADFSELIAEHNIVFITDILQKIHIDISEENVEQPGSVKVAGSGKKLQAASKSFIADHPFIFYIKAKNSIIVAGRVVSPI